MLRSLRQPRPGLVVRDQVAALDLEARIEQRLEPPAAERRAERLAVAARLGAGHVEVGRGVVQLDGDLAEAERAADAFADRVEHLAHRAGLGHARGDLEQALEREPVAGGVGRLLRGLHRQGGVLGHRDEDVELVGGRLPARDGLVHREDSEQVPVAVPHRHDQGVLRVPGAGVVGRFEIGHVVRHRLVRPVVLAVGDQVGAALLEALVEQRLPRLEVARLAEQQRARVVVPVHRRHLERVPGRPVEVDDDGPEAERLRDRAGDLVEHRRKVALAPDQPRDVEQAAKPREDRGMAVLDHGGASKVRGPLLRLPPSFGGTVAIRQFGPPG